MNSKMLLKELGIVSMSSEGDVHSLAYIWAECICDW
jgi:hypothetical protein